MSTATNLQVANTILAQLGGRRFTVMTGAKNYVGGEDHLMFSLPSTAHFVKDGINKVRITLTPMDVYKVEFFKLRGVNCKLIHEVEEVYAEDLRGVFTEYTGLYTSL